MKVEEWSVLKEKKILGLRILLEGDVPTQVSDKRELPPSSE